MIIKVKRYIRILDHKTSLNAFCFRAYSRFVVLDYAKDSFTSRIISVFYKLQNKSITRLKATSLTVKGYRFRIIYSRNRI